MGVGLDLANGKAAVVGSGDYRVSWATRYLGFYTFSTGSRTRLPVTSNRLKEFRRESRACEHRITIDFLLSPSPQRRWNRYRRLKFPSLHVTTTIPSTSLMPICATHTPPIHCNDSIVVFPRRIQHSPKRP